jgi:hypothetical protein
LGAQQHAVKKKRKKEMVKSKQLEHENLIRKKRKKQKTKTGKMRSTGSSLQLKCISCQHIFPVFVFLVSMICGVLTTKTFCTQTHAQNELAS